jgi:hypothetical protein
MRTEQWVTANLRISQRSALHNPAIEQSILEL